MSTFKISYYSYKGGDQFIDFTLISLMNRVHQLSYFRELFYLHFNLCCFKKKSREKWGVFLMWIINSESNDFFYIKYNQFGKNVHTATLVAKTISYL